MNISDFEGARIFAQDGQYLGMISRDQYSEESISNAYGSYGSVYSATSILNQYGSYGGAYSAHSPFNEYTSTAPKIIKDGVFIAYLTINSYQTPRVDPAVLLRALGIDI